ncbi:MAG: hypothetical protein V9G25_08325 [Acidimicrobiia bacterium]
MKTNRKNYYANNKIVITFLILAVISIAFTACSSKDNDKTKKDSSKTDLTTPAKAEEAKWPTGNDATWSSDGHGGWITLPYDSKAPACPDPLNLNLPTTNIDQATSILYPGQSRSGTYEGLGGTYKAHGGFRFDNNQTNEIEVVMPFNGSITRAVSLLIDGEPQYGFDIQNECGIMIRLGHLHDLTPKFQKIVDALPVGTVANSESQKIEPSIPFKQGDVIATVVGFKNSHNVGFDYGVYDLRSNNEASKDPAYVKAHSDTAELSYHGLCWLENLNDKDKAIVKALPAGDQTTGKTSDYCNSTLGN